MEFEKFGKIPRFNRKVVVTEKIDGTNAQIYIDENGEMFVGSSKRWITPTDDNYSFAQWCEDNKPELLKLGHGRHYGEWWGKGIQRNYGLEERRFSMFNTRRWCLCGQIPKKIENADPRIEKIQDILPTCVGLIPVLWEGLFEYLNIDFILDTLKACGSLAAPGFMKPEGIVIYHVAGNLLFKKTIEKDEEYKGK